MPLFTADALILRTYKLGESDRIVVFLTDDRGKKRGVAKGARRPRSRFVGALEPLTQVRLAYFEKEHRELVWLELRRAVALAVVGPAGGARAHRLLRRAPRSVGAGRRSERTAVSPRRVAPRSADRRRRRSSRWRGISSSGCCGSRACTRRSRRAMPAAARSTPRAAGRISPRGAPCSRARPAPRRRTCGSPICRAPRWRFCAPRAGYRLGDVTALDVSGDTLAELETVHRLLMGRHLERELKSTRVLRDLRRAARVAPLREAEAKR